MTDYIYFPGLGFGIPVPSQLNIFGVRIALYGIVVSIGFVLGLALAIKLAKETKQNPEDYLDFFLVMVIPAILGARIYYIIFNASEFISEGKSFGQIVKDMLNIRNGGLAFYGGLIAGVIAFFIFTKVKKMYIPLVGDTIVPGILVGQILGRWGNFFNREVFGRYTSSVFRMAIPYDYYSTSFKAYLSDVGIVTQEMLDNMETVNGVRCITVHPTFIYEILWNVALLVILLFWWKRKRFDGEITMFYFFGYGVGRFIIEGIRADTLMFGPFKVSQLVSVAFIIVTVTILAKNYISINRGKEPVIHRLGEVVVEKEEKKSENKEDSKKDSDDKNEKVENDEKEGNRSTNKNYSSKKKKK